MSTPTNKPAKEVAKTAPTIEAQKSAEASGTPPVRLEVEKIELPSEPLDRSISLAEMENETDATIVTQKGGGASVIVARKSGNAAPALPVVPDSSPDMGKRGSRRSQQKKKSFISRLSPFKKGKKNLNASGVESARSLSPASKYSKKQIKNFTKDAENYDTKGDKEYHAKKYQDAVESYEQAHQFKRIIFGEHSTQVAYAVEKLAKAEDMVVESFTIEGDQGGATEDIDVSNNRIAMRMNALTHYRDAHRIFQVNGIDCVRILTDMGNFLYREGMDDEALECYETLTTLERKDSDTENAEASKAYFQMGEIYRGRDQHEKAIDSFEKAYLLQKGVFGDVYNSNAILLYHAALSQVQIADDLWVQNDHENAKQYYSASLESFDKALTISRSTSKGDDEAIKTDMLRHIAYLNMKLDDVTSAIDAYAEIIALLKDSDGSNDEVESLLKLKAAAHMKKHEFGDAIRSLEESLALLRARLKYNDSSEVLTILQQLGPLQYKAKNFEGAIESFKEVLRLGLRLDMELERFADVNFNLGSLYELTGSKENAIETYKSSKSYYLKRFGDDHPKVATILHRLGNLYWEKEIFPDSLECYGLVLKMMDRNPSLKFKNMESVFNNMGYVLYNVGDFEKAAGMYKEALDVAIHDVKGSDYTSSSGILAIRNNYANVLVQVGRCEEAIDLYEEALRAKELLDGTGSIGSTNLMYNIGTAYMKSGKLSKALEYFEKARAIRTKELGADHMDVMIVYSQIGSVYAAMNNYETSKRIYTKVLRTRNDRLGAEDENTMNSMMNQAFVLYKCGDFDVAYEFYDNLLLLTNEHDTELRAAIWHGMGNIHVKRKEFDQAVKAYSDALQLKKKLDTLEKKAVGRSIARSQHNLGMVYCQQMLLIEAEVTLEEALKTSKEVMKPNDPEIGKILIDLGKVHYKKPDYELAKASFIKAKQLFMDSNLPEDHVLMRLVDERLRKTAKRIARRTKRKEVMAQTNDLTSPEPVTLLI